ncbi:T9SS type A sorting domain-containing protein [Winogradskyella sp. R77965]|uniref:T9SS type A sorting domain-containing protein n=1 Tax=Winogradskyella sp. R77965 TaxID=3093872 RepID=UPI0037DCBA15
MKKLYIIYFASVFCVPLMAQTAVTASGGNASGTGGTASYTVGQIIDTNINGSNGSVNHGVQQPIEFFTLDVDDYLNTDFKISVFPNPTSVNIQLNIDNYNSNDFNYFLYDVYGRTILHQKIKDSDTIITIESLASATYYLKITENNRIIKTVKILKN